MTELDLSQVHISKRTSASILLVVLSLVVLYLGATVIAPFAGALAMGAVLGALFYPVHLTVFRWVKRHSLAASITTVLMLVAFLGPLAWLGMQVGQELTGVYRSIGSGTMNVQAQQLWQSTERLLNRWGPSLGVSEADIKTYVQGKVGEASATVLQQGLAALSAITEGIVFAFFSGVAFFFAVRDGPAFMIRLLIWSPLGVRHTAVLFEAVRQTIFSSFYGVIVVAAAQGVLLGIGAWITGLPSPVLWGVATGIASVMPLFGSALVWVPAAGLLFVQGSAGKAILMVVWGLAVVGTVDNILRPLVVNTGMPVNGLVILIAMLGGVQAFGLAGILIGPLTVALILALAQVVGERMHGPPEAQRPKASAVPEG